MNQESLARLSDTSLVQSLKALLARERSVLAEVIAHLAEVDARKLHAPAGYPSLYTYCVGELRLSEQSAYKRILVARAARKCPALLAALADGRLHLSAATQLAPHLSGANARELIAAVSHKTRVELEHLLAERFPRPDVPDLMMAMPATSAPGGSMQGPEARSPEYRQLSPGIVQSPSTVQEPPRSVSTTAGLVQYAADCAFGAGFMREKRRAAAA